MTVSKLMFINKIFVGLHELDEVVQKSPYMYILFDVDLHKSYL